MSLAGMMAPVRSTTSFGWTCGPASGPPSARAACPRRRGEATPPSCTATASTPSEASLAARPSTTSAASTSPRVCGRRCGQARPRPRRAARTSAWCTAVRSSSLGGTTGGTTLATASSGPSRRTEARRRRRSRATSSAWWRAVSSPTSGSRWRERRCPRTSSSSLRVASTFGACSPPATPRRRHRQCASRASRTRPSSRCCTTCTLAGRAR
mmetsp:Transcript_49651/g.159506  ORF Transcript_49651/g.159506 Transcript_49651/m.159506 type:complete len:211 (-) Transcript_49651:584-1216(-)